MNLSLESCKYRLCQIDKTDKIFDNVAFLRSHFLKEYFILPLSLLVIVYASLFIISLNIGQKGYVQY